MGIVWPSSSPHKYHKHVQNKIKNQHYTPALLYQSLHHQNSELTQYPQDLVMIIHTTNSMQAQNKKYLSKLAS